MVLARSVSWEKKGGADNGIPVGAGYMVAGLAAHRNAHRKDVEIEAARK